MVDDLKNRGDRILKNIISGITSTLSSVQCVFWFIYRITLATCSIISAGRRITFVAVSTVAAKWNQIRMSYFQIEGRVD